MKTSSLLILMFFALLAWNGCSGKTNSTPSVSGMFVDKDLVWHAAGSPLLSPPEKVLKALFGLRRLEFPMGLYFNVNHGESILREERVGVHSLSDGKTNGYVGSLINFRNVQFLLWLNENNINGSFRTWNGQLSSPDQNPPEYHIKSFSVTARSKVSGVIRFDWTEKTIELS